MAGAGRGAPGDDVALPPWWRRVRPPRLGLRARITLAFTLSAALLSVLMAGTTWGVTREKPEYEDLAAIARERGIPLDEVRQAAEAAMRVPEA